MVETYHPPEHLLFVKIDARELKVGDIIKTTAGLREILSVKIGRNDVIIGLRDREITTLPLHTHQVLVQ